MRLARSLPLTIALLIAAPAGAHAATVTVTPTNLTFAGDPGETNVGVIAEQSSGVYFVGDQGGATVTPSDAATTLACPAAMPPLPPGRLCAAPTATTLTMNLADGNDTGVVNDTTGTPATINGGPGNDQLVGGFENDTFVGDAGTDTVAYAGINQPGLMLSRTDPITAALPDPGPATTANNGRTGENDTIDGDVEGLVGGNGSDNLTGGSGADIIAGAVPPGTPLATTSPAGNDTINGNDGADLLLGGDSGAVNGGAGADQIVGGRSTSATTTIHGGADNDTIVSGLGDDSVFGDGGFNTLAYASVAQGALTIVNRGTNGVTATLPNTGQTAGGGRTGSAENDTIHDDIQTLVGSNGSDNLTGSNRADVILGVAPAGTPNVVPGPPGNDTLTGGAGPDVLLGAGGNDLIRSRDGTAESPVCGGGNDVVTADKIDTPAADCERVDNPAIGTSPGVTPPVSVTDRSRPQIRERPSVLVLRRGRRVVLRLGCPNEASGCHGRLVIKTRRKVKLGRRHARRYTLARVRFFTTGPHSHRLRIKLSRTTLRLVRRGHSIRLLGALRVRDDSGNLATKTLRLRLKRR